MSTLEVTERIRSGWIRFRAGLLAEGAIIAIAAAALIVALRPTCQRPARLRRRCSRD